MGMVCENCGWRKNPNDNTGRRCIFTNTKKIWSNDSYNKPCNNYIMDTTLKEHLTILLDINAENKTNSMNKDGRDIGIIEIIKNKTDEEVINLFKYCYFWGVLDRNCDPSIVNDANNYFNLIGNKYEDTIKYINKYMKV